MRARSASGDACEVEAAPRQPMPPAMRARRNINHLSASITGDSPVLDELAEAGDTAATVVVSHQPRQFTGLPDGDGMGVLVFAHAAVFGDELPA